MSRAYHLNSTLTAVCTDLLDEFDLTDEEITNLAANIPGECKAIRENREEAAWQERQDALAESGGTDDGAYRKQMIEARRGHLLKG